MVRTSTNCYGLPERMNLVVGRLQMKARGFGFVLPEQAGDPDLYIPATEMNGAMSGDKVMARVEKGSVRRMGARARSSGHRAGAEPDVVTLFAHHGFVSPLDKRYPQDVFIAGADMNDAHDGYVVVAEITTYPTATRGPEGRVVEVLGHPDAPGVDILGVIRKYGLPEHFPAEVLEAAEAIPLTVGRGRSRWPARPARRNHRHHRRRGRQRPGRCGRRQAPRQRQLRTRRAHRRRRLVREGRRRARQGSVQARHQRLSWSIASFPCCRSASRTTSARSTRRSTG